MKKLVLLFIGMAMLSGCAISKHVTPVDSTASIRKIYVLVNDKVHMKELVNEIVDQLKEQGFESEAYSGDRPKEALHYLTYTGNWNWDMAMYLTYFRATLYEDGRVLGEVEYDAKMGGANMAKFGRTSEKIRPLMIELLEKVKRPTVGDG